MVRPDHTSTYETHGASHLRQNIAHRNHDRPLKTDQLEISTSADNVLLQKQIFRAQKMKNSSLNNTTTWSDLTTQAHMRPMAHRIYASSTYLQTGTDNETSTSKIRPFAGSQNTHNAVKSRSTNTATNHRITPHGHASTHTTHGASHIMPTHWVLKLEPGTNDQQ